MLFKIPDNITNPKTLRKWQAYKDQYDKWESFAKDNGYKVERTLKAGANSSYSFTKDGVSSAYGFDCPEDVLKYIFDNKPTAP